MAIDVKKTSINLALTIAAVCIAQLVVLPAIDRFFPNLTSA